MKKATLKKVLPVAIAIVVGVFLVLAMRYWFDHSSSVQSLFYGDNSNAVIGEVAEDSGASLADRSQMAARLSMYIFTVITVLQLVAFGVGCAVVSGVKQASGSVKKRLALLDNCEIFFDVPLYVGLFGTVSAFLVMTFSPSA